MHLYINSLMKLIFLLFSALPAVIASEFCNECQGCCFDTTYGTALCKCDKECTEFGDCCGKNYPSNFSSTSMVPSGTKLDCHSVITIPDTPVIAENEAYLMVSSCPDSWVDPEDSFISINCSTPTQPLPPVTAITTGLVYRNEYCAQCNGVAEIIAWSSRLLCNSSIIESYAIVKAINNNLDILNTACSPCSFQPPNIEIFRLQNPRTCIPRVQQCLPYFELQSKTGSRLDFRQYMKMVDNCLHGPLNLVHNSKTNKVYSNEDCALCNGEFFAHCFKLEDRDVCCPNGGCDDKNRPISFTFTITLSNLGKGLVDVSSSDYITGTIKPCRNGEVLIGTKCKPTLCPEGYSLKGGKCLYYGLKSKSLSKPFPDDNFTSINCSNPILVLDNGSYINLGNDTILLLPVREKVKVLEYDEFGCPVICVTDELFHLDCSSALVALNESDYVALNSSTIIVGNKVIEVRYHDEYGRPLICPELINSTSNYTTMKRLLPSLPGIQELTYIGCSLSVLGGIAVLLTYSLFGELQTLPGLVLMNLCIPITGTSLLFVIGGPLIQYQPLSEICTTLAILLHFLYLSQFSWMSIFSFEMTRNFYQARKMAQVTKGTKWKYFAIYLTVGWVLPIVLTATTIILNFSIDDLVIYGNTSEDEMAGCWINHQLTYIIAFVIPVVLSLFLNLIFFFVTTVFICRTHRDQSRVHKSNINAMIRIWFAVFTTSGLTWIFGFLAVFKDLSWMWYLFVILNSIQGICIFLAFIFTMKVLNLYKSLLKKKLKRNQSSVRTMKITRSTTL